MSRDRAAPGIPSHEGQRERDSGQDIDGCSRARVSWAIVLPLSRPALVVVALFTFLNTWNEFSLAFPFLKDRVWHTITLAPLQYTGQVSPQLSLTFAATLPLASPPVAIFLAPQRWYVRGLTAGAPRG